MTTPKATDRGIRHRAIPTDPAVWQPGTYEEVAGIEKLRAFLEVRVKDSESDRRERVRIASCVIGLLAFQMLATVGLLIAIGAHFLDLPLDVLGWALPGSLAVEFVGVLHAIARYLFADKSRESLDALMRDAPARRSDT